MIETLFRLATTEITPQSLAAWIWTGAVAVPLLWILVFAVRRLKQSTSVGRRYDKWLAAMVPLQLVWLILWAAGVGHFWLGALGAVLVLGLLIGLFIVAMDRQGSSQPR